jgi:hypothetical protein
MDLQNSMLFPLIIAEYKLQGSDTSLASYFGNKLYYFDPSSG